jgi:hypothetical protein
MSVIHSQTFSDVFYDVPFGKYTTDLSFPPGEKPFFCLNDIYILHPFEQTFDEEYWNDDYWGPKEDLRTINSEIISNTIFLKKGLPDEEYWMALLEVNIYSEVCYLYIRAHCCYTGFGVGGFVHIYASSCIDSLRKMCMSPNEEALVFDS